MDARALPSVLVRVGNEVLLHTRYFVGGNKGMVEDDYYIQAKWPNSCRRAQRVKGQRPRKVTPLFSDNGIKTLGDFVH